MNEEKEEICFTIIYNLDSYVVRTYHNEYRNLMVLLKDKIDPGFFGECGGMGRCGTCLINILESPVYLENKHRNEQSTLSKMGISDQATRLSCQVLIDKELNNVTIEVLNDFV